MYTTKKICLLFAQYLKMLELNWHGMIEFFFFFCISESDMSLLNSGQVQICVHDQFNECYANNALKTKNFIGSAI